MQIVKNGITEMLIGIGNGLVLKLVLTAMKNISIYNYLA
jgi:hypothetical protein